VRADAVAPVELQPNAPSWILMPHKQRAAVAGWQADERCSTFSVVVHDGTPQRLEGFKLAVNDNDADGDGVDDDMEVVINEDGSVAEPPPPPKAMHLSVRVGQTNLLVRNLLRTPILEVEMKEVKIGELGFGAWSAWFGVGKEGGEG